MTMWQVGDRVRYRGFWCPGTVEVADLGTGYASVAWDNHTGSWVPMAMLIPVSRSRVGPWVMAVVLTVAILIGVVATLTGGM